MIDKLEKVSDLFTEEQLKDSIKSVSEKIAKNIEETNRYIFEKRALESLLHSLQEESL